MGKRSTSRRLAMQALYQADLSKMEIDQALENIFEDEKPIAETRKFAKKLAGEAWKRLSEIDGLIKKYSKDWKIERIGAVDRNILRLALGELMMGETPREVAVDEAVELAKKYSSPEAAKFINGILASYIKEMSI